jgi:oleate hydratase
MKNQKSKAYLIGSGIASLASAVYLIKDGKFSGKNIFIFDEAKIAGGSLDAAGSPEIGYAGRGSRMFSEEVYSCVFDLFSKIPLNGKTSKTLLDDFIEFNKKIKINAKARLVEGGKIVDPLNFGLSIRDSADMIKIMTLPESYFGDTKISDHFLPAFFKTNFWFEWRTTFAFQPWHSAMEFKRYVLRFIQEFPRMNTLSGARLTRYNQNDSVVTPTTNWLKSKGVKFLMESRVSSLKFIKKDNKEQVSKISYFKKNGARKEFIVGPSDLVFLTNGSMTANAVFGGMKSVPLLDKKALWDPWALWKNISKDRPYFGDPSVFDGHIDKTKWESFSVTFKDPLFINLMKAFSKNKPGTGGLITIKDSNWLLSVAIAPEPHFKGQPKNIHLLWGYGLYPDKKGNYIHKKMSECTGEEILTEVCSHLGFLKDMPKILKSANCMPCMMPYITSQFMPRKIGDRPNVIPEGTRNFAFIGQFCEIPDEVVFTVEQSVRSAMTAVYGLLGIKKDIPSIYRGQHDLKTIEALVKMGFNIGLATFIPSHGRDQNK